MQTFCFSGLIRLKWQKILIIEDARIAESLHQSFP